MSLPVRSVVAICLTLMAVPAAADPPSWSGAWQVHEGYHRPAGDAAGAPVPFAALIGDGEVPVARGLPYGFNRGTCDDALLNAAGARELAAAGAFGRAMAANDRECLWAALERLPDKRSITWVGENGTLFWVGTQRTYMKAGTACRDWSGQAARPDGSTWTSGTYCRRSDGQWVSAQ